MTSSALVLALEDDYNMDEIGLFYYAQPNKTLAQGKICEAQNLEGLPHSWACCKHNRHWRAETCDNQHISMPKMLWKVVGNKIMCGDLQTKWHEWHSRRFLGIIGQESSVSKIQLVTCCCDLSVCLQ